MAAMRVDTDQVAQIATEIEGLNNDLMTELTNSKAVVDGLANIWEGEASQATIQAYDEFAKKYFDQYKEVIDNYVKFLRQNVEKGYFDTEQANISLADAFK